MYLKLLIFLFLTGGLFAGNSKISVLLKNNDIIVGDLQKNQFQLQSEYGLLNVDLARIKEIKFLKKPKITFMNNDVLEAQIKASSISVDCEFGLVSIDLSKVSLIRKGPVFPRNPELKWSEAKDGLSLGIKLNVRTIKNKKAVIVYSELINESGKEVKLKYPHFYDGVKVSAANTHSDNLYSIFLFGSQSTLEMLENIQMQSIEGPILMPGAKVIMEFELEVTDVKLAEMLKEYESSENLPPKIKKVLHFKQKISGYSPKSGRNFLQLHFHYGKGKSQKLISPKVYWENK